MHILPPCVHVIEPFAGTAAFSRALVLNGLPAPTSFAGNKDAFCDCLLQLANVSSKQVKAVTLNDAGLYGLIYEFIFDHDDVNELTEFIDHVLQPEQCRGVEFWLELRSIVSDIRVGKCLHLPRHVQVGICLAYLAGSYGSLENASSFRGRHKNRPHDTGFVPRLSTVAERVRRLSSATTAQVLNDAVRWRVHRCDAAHLLSLYEPVATAGNVSEMLVVVIDPPYAASCRPCYWNQFTRWQTLCLAVDWAVNFVDVCVLVCEAEPLDEPLNHLTRSRFGISWESFEISDCRTGHCRVQTSKSGRATEFVTRAVRGRFLAKNNLRLNMEKIE